MVINQEALAKNPYGFCRTLPQDESEYLSPSSIGSECPYFISDISHTHVSVSLVGNMKILDPIMPDNNGLISQWNYLQTGSSSELSPFSFIALGWWAT